MGITNFNKIIDLYFLNDNDAIVAQIKCPTHGRKPNITLTGAMYGRDIPNDFDITVKNFYIDSILSSAKKLRVYAGYEDKRRIMLESTIAYMHQESPGPESTTVVHCMFGQFVEWMTKTVDINLDKGYTLQAALAQISKPLGLKTPVVSSAIQEVSEESFQFQGACKDAIAHLERSFDGVHITIDSGTFVAYKEAGTSPGAEIDLPYLSAPPIIKAGSESMLASATISAPWNPILKPGDIVTFNSAYYQSTEYLKNFRQERSRIEITSLQFHFATVGSANQMTIEGIAADKRSA